MEIKSVKVGDQEIKYNLRRRKRVRYLRLSVGVDGSLSVTAPVAYPQFLIRQFILHRFAWVQSAIAKRLSRPSIFREQHSAQEIKHYQALAKRIILERLEHFNKFYRLSYKKITIRKATTRWGSCSKKGNLNFNYRLYFLAPELLDYVVVHELCHLQEFNHSQAFWRLVGQKIPDYRLLRKKLKNLR
ncbi:MAG: M48 family metallopeptidase [Patescibacteria group bacterium]